LQPLELKSIFNIKQNGAVDATSAKGLSSQGMANQISSPSNKSSQQFLSLLNELVNDGSGQPGKDSVIDPGTLALLKDALAQSTNVPVESIDDGQLIAELNREITDKAGGNFIHPDTSLLKSGQVEQHKLQQATVKQSLMTPLQSQISGRQERPLRIRTLQLPTDKNSAIAKQTTTDIMHHPASLRPLTDSETEYKKLISLNRPVDVEQNANLKRLHITLPTNQQSKITSKVNPEIGSLRDVAGEEISLDRIISKESQPQALTAESRVRNSRQADNVNRAAIRIAQMDVRPQTVEQTLLEQRVLRPEFEQKDQNHRILGNKRTATIYGKGQQLIDSSIIGRSSKALTPAISSSARQPLAKVQPEFIAPAKSSTVPLSGSVNISQLYDVQHDQNLIRQSGFHPIADLNNSSSSVTTGQTLKAESGGTSSSVELVGKITDYLVQQGVGDSKEVQVTVNDDQLGVVKLKVAKSNAGEGKLDVKIVTDNQKAQEFFAKHEGVMVQKLGEANIKVNDLQVSVNKLGLVSDQVAKESSSAKNFENNSNSNSNERSSSQGRHQSQSERHAKDQDSQRRQELWEQFSRRSAA
jgi:hypothetical protein